MRLCVYANFSISSNNFALSTAVVLEDCYCQKHYIIYRITLASKVDIFKFVPGDKEGKHIFMVWLIQLVELGFNS